MRVALVHPWFWPEVRRGAERFARELANGLIARGHDVWLVTSHSGPRAERLEDGLAVVRVPRRRGNLRALGFADPVSHLPDAMAALRGIGPDAAVALMPLDALAAQASGVPTVFAAMGIPTPLALEKLRGVTRLQGLAARRCAAATALSEAATDGFRTLLGAETTTIPAPVDTVALTPDPAARAEVPTVLFAGAPDVPRKRLRLLARAMEQVREAHPQARLLVDRPRGAQLRELLEAAAGIEVRPLDDHADLVRAYREAWVSALPAIGEAFGLVLAEGLACGTPGVARDEGGMPEVIGGRPECGRVFRGESAEALAAALLEALDLWKGDGVVEACRNRALDFSTARVGEQYEELLAAVAGRG